VVRPPERRERAGLTAVIDAFCDGARARYDALMHQLGSILEAVPSVPHWHLPRIGVDPARQGIGLGSLLLRAGLSRVDQDGVECQLFTEHRSTSGTASRLPSRGTSPTGGCTSGS
jgi:ribosomal protein S18 acetylase RimI-like enzyme